MPRKDKDYLPKNMEDLEKIFYGSNKDGRDVDLYRLRRYLDMVRTKNQSPASEDYAKKRFAPLGKIEKIPENQKHTNFDYKIDDWKLLLEVTSLNVDETFPTNLTKRDTLKKLEGAIDHILTKDSSSFPGYGKGGAIIYTLTFNLFSKFSELLDDKLPKISEILKNDLDFLVFIPEPASIDQKSSLEIFPPVFYVKGESLAEVFKEAFKCQNCKILLV